MKTILTVDDSPCVLQMIATVLRVKGFEVLEASNGSQALAMMDGRVIDLVITDLLMPKMNGVELIREIRNSRSYQAVPILMLTTQSNEGMIEAGEKAGAGGWIVKPFQSVGLIDQVREMLRVTESE